jgi:tRNA (guanine-N7-)-methyltransferase
MGRMRKKKNLAARLERCAHLLVQNPEEHKGRWREFLGLDRSARLEAEIGCGKGGFAVKTAESFAENNENAFLLAFDRIDNVLVTGMELAAARGIKKLLFVRQDASALLDIFAPGEVDRIYINFCDPWPARRHECRRLTHPDFLNIFKGILSPHGDLRFKTDNKDLFLYSLKSFEENGWELCQTAFDLHSQNIPNITTEYEERFLSLGMQIYYAHAKPKL